MGINALNYESASAHANLSVSRSNIIKLMEFKTSNFDNFIHLERKVVQVVHIGSSL